MHLLGHSLVEVSVFPTNLFYQNMIISTDIINGNLEWIIELLAIVKCGRCDNEDQYM